MLGFMYKDMSEIMKICKEHFLHKFVQMENIVTLEMVYGTNQEVTIAEDEHLSLTIGADITLIPIK